MTEDEEDEDPDVRFVRGVDEPASGGGGREEEEDDEVDDNDDDDEDDPNQEIELGSEDSEDRGQGAYSGLDGELYWALGSFCFSRNIVAFFLVLRALRV